MRVMVTAGPTREPIDPVRYLSNRSSGKMGYAIAGCAIKRGHEVRLISGPVALKPPDGVDPKMVVTAEEMLRAVESSMPWCDVLIMAAAVADWRPRLIRSQKIKKFNGVMSLELEPAPDILQSIRSMKGGRIIVGFAAETENLIAEAQAKMARKGLDLIVANDVTQSDAGFEVDTNRVVMIAAGCAPEPLPLMSKEDVAGKILEWVEAHGRHC